MLSGQVAVPPLVTQTGKKEFGEGALVDMLSASFGQGGTGDGFNNHLNKMLQPAKTNVDEATRISARASAPEKSTPAPQAAPQQKPDALEQDATPEQAQELANTNEVSSQDNHEPGERSEPVKNLNAAAKELKEATKALDEAMQKGTATGEELAALVVAVAQAVQHVQAALEQFQSASLPPSAAPRIDNLLTAATNVLSQLQQWASAPQTPTTEGEAAPQQSFSDALNTLLGNDTAVDSTDIVEQLTAQVNSVKNLLTALRVHVAIQQAAPTLQAANTDASNPVQQTQTNVAPVEALAPQQDVETQTNAPAPKQVADVSSATKVEQPQPSAKVQNTSQPAPVTAAVSAQTSGDAGDNQNTGNQQFSSQQSKTAEPQGVSSNTASHRTNAVSFEQHMRSTSGAKVVEQIQLQIKSAVKDGVSRIVVKLDPVELGEVEIKMEIGATGKTGVVISCDRPQTLELLQRDVKQLQQMLTDLGLNADADSLSFNLRGGDQQQGQGQQYKPSKYPALSDEFEEEVAAIVPLNTTLSLRSGVNIKV